MRSCLADRDWYESVWIDVKSSLRSMSRREEEKAVTPPLLKQVFPFSLGSRDSFCR